MDMIERVELDREFMGRFDYVREAYGDPCPIHRVLRWQAGCPVCEQEAYEEMYAQGMI